MNKFKYHITPRIDRWIVSTVRKCNEYLKELGLSVIIDPDYPISEDCVAVYKAGSVIDFDGKMCVGINKEVLIDFCKKENCTDREIEQQVSISIWHEAGHGILDWMRNEVSTFYSMMEDDPESIPENIDSVMDSFYEKWEYILAKEDNDEEEEMVEEFGIHMGGGLARNHDLEMMIDDFKEYMNAEWYEETE